MEEDLDRLEVLLLDCQTTGASPAQGHLLEIAWCRYRAADPLPGAGAVRSFLIRQPQRQRIPAPIRRLTGITDQDLQRAIDRNDLWRRLRELRQALPGPPQEPAFAVAHYARFEHQFLRHLHRECEPASPYPFRWLCTHEIARRLFPDLPRRGLRPLAGLFGTPLPALRRAAPHVQATAGVWRHLVLRLRAERGVTRWGQLWPLLRGPVPTRGPRFSYPLARERRLALPECPGIYRFLGGAGEVLYVGKANSLRKRVNSYYRKRRADEKLLELVSQVRDVAVEETPTALEAALLEAETIRRLDPPYNRALRDRGQGVWFFSCDLKRARPEADRGCYLGPIPHREGLTHLRTLARLFGGHPLPPRMIRSLGLNALQGQPANLAAAARIFREVYGLAEPAPAPRALLRLGMHLWTARARDSEAAEASASAPREDPGPLTEPDPDAVAAHLTQLITAAARLRCRARWLLWLAEAIVCWYPASTAQRMRRLLVVERGIPGPARDHPTGRPLPTPPGAQRPYRDRLATMDRAAYDLLRVLSSELRRLTRDPAPAGPAVPRVEVVLASNRRLTGRGLDRILACV